MKTLVIEGLSKLVHDEVVNRLEANKTVAVTIPELRCIVFVFASQVAFSDKVSDLMYTLEAIGCSQLFHGIYNPNGAVVTIWRDTDELGGEELLRECGYFIEKAAGLIDGAHRARYGN